MRSSIQRTSLAATKCSVPRIGQVRRKQVRADEDEAHRLGIDAVPSFVLGGVYGVSGAQPVEVLHQALTQAMAEPPQRAIPEGAVCGPEGCG